MVAAGSSPQLPHPTASPPPLAVAARLAARTATAAAAAAVAPRACDPDAPPRGRVWTVPGRPARPRRDGRPPPRRSAATTDHAPRRGRPKREAEGRGNGGRCAVADCSGAGVAEKKVRTREGEGWTASPLRSGSRGKSVRMEPTTAITPRARRAGDGRCPTPFPLTPCTIPPSLPTVFIHLSAPPPPRPTTARHPATHPRPQPLITRRHHRHQ